MTSRVVISSIKDLFIPPRSPFKDTLSHPLSITNSFSVSTDMVLTDGLLKIKNVFFFVFKSCVCTCLCVGVCGCRAHGRLRVSDPLKRELRVVV